jgi:hypothetical protein
MVGAVKEVAGGRFSLRCPLGRIIPVWDISLPIRGA